MDTSDLIGDEKKWAESTDDRLYEIAKTWAKKWTTKKLRSFQSYYLEILEKHPNMSEGYAKAMQNRWQCATFAISIREFGE
jgi:hypothetical protein